MRSTKNDSTSLDSPAPAKSPPDRSDRRKTVAITIVVVVAIVVIASTFVLDQHTVTSPRGPPHIGIISLSEISQLAGQQLTIFYRNNSSQVRLNITSEETVAFNTSNHTSSWKSSPPRVLVISYEFTNQTQSSFSYNISYSIQKQALAARNSTTVIRNMSFEGFTYFLVISNYSGIFSVVSAGYSGSYAFLIGDINVPLSSYIALIHKEIQAMTS
ncbi:MAG: hypothetical protein M1161_01060 [Candidatus Thermoplasmatota archaeon]|nr:hypothetical protein [Candidatus Thermoplasmatota archaeon]